jgi:hypothetical protein
LFIRNYSIFPKSGALKIGAFTLGVGTAEGKLYEILRKNDGISDNRKKTVKLLHKTCIFFIFLNNIFFNAFKSRTFATIYCINIVEISNIFLGRLIYFKKW